MKKKMAMRLARVFLAFLVSAFLVSWNIPRTVCADAGELDPSFGIGGKVVTDIGGSESGTAIAIQQDGKIVVAGSYEIESGESDHDFGVARYLADGSLDTEFGVGGLNGLDFFGGEDIAHAVAIQPDGKIVVAGEIYNTATNNADFGLGRFNPDGSIDESFGNGNAVTTDFSGLADQAMGVALQSDGKIVVAGVTGRDVFLQCGLARYNPDGSLDISFGSGGKAEFYSLNAYAVNIQPDGKILVAGSANVWEDYFALARLNSDGSFDSSFGIGGMETGDALGCAYSLLIQPDGAIILAGTTTVDPSSTYNDFCLLRFASNGRLDTSFGTSGGVWTDFFGESDAALAVALQPDGKILAAGFAERSSGSGNIDFALARYHSDGSPDSTFGSGGKVTTDFSGDEDRAFSMALTSDARIVLAGYAHNPTSEDLALACYLMGPLGEIPGFDLWFGHPTINGTRGKKVKITVNISRTGGFTGNVTVMPPDLKAEGIITKSPDPKDTSGTTASWKFKIRGSAATGPHQLTFMGRDAAGKERTATVTLSVN
jgi:uncharacterized delta-60 repeat protein